ncbi:hypothetical protein C8J57DRAFT_1339089, partial [Mycena rebaudengoi]
MEKAWNKDPKHFGRVTRTTTFSTPRCLSCPWFFCIQPSDPRFTNTLKQIMNIPFVFRYDIH